MDGLRRRIKALPCGASPDPRRTVITLLNVGGEFIRKSFSIMFSAVLLLIFSVPGSWAQHVKFYDLGHYPGGTWADPWGIKKAGVIVGMGDIRSGYTRPIGVPVFGRDAGQWFDLGTLGGERTDTYVMCMAIADTGMIVGQSALSGVNSGPVHAFAWTQKSGIIDIGTLADLDYTGYNFSVAGGRSSGMRVNNNGIAVGVYGNGDIQHAVAIKLR